MPNRDYHHERREYDFDALTLEQMNEDPFKQFSKWMDFALQQPQIKDATAMSVATVSADGQPHSRVVLLKGFSHDGFVFYTSYDSDKGHQIEANPRAALLFFWPEFDRQIRIEGQLEKLPAEASEIYFHNRPRDSQLAAYISKQSHVVEDRATLETRLAEAAEKFDGQDIPKPDSWGGYRLNAHHFEFWQGRPSRLHDRFRYTMIDRLSWQIDRLSP